MAQHKGALALVIALIGSNLFALFVEAIYEYLTLLGVVTLDHAWLALLFAWIVAVIGISVSVRALSKTVAQRLCGVIAAMVLGVVLIGFHTYMIYSLKLPALPSPPAPPVAPRIMPSQTAIDSPCANLNAGANAQIVCHSGGDEK
jgi:hypothetical protein